MQKQLHKTNRKYKNIPVKIIIKQILTLCELLVDTMFQNLTNQQSSQNKENLSLSEAK